MTHPNEISADQTIEKVLRGLRDCDPPSAMNTRILQAMQAVQPMQATKPQTHWQALILGVRTLARLPRTSAINRPLVLASTLCAVGLAAGWLYLSNTNHAAPVPVAHQPPTLPVAVTSQPSPKPGFARQDSNVVSRGVSAGSSSSIPLQAVATRVRIHSQREDAAADRDSDSATEAVSFPAPPLPLTPQERLLLQIAHRSNPQNLIDLTASAEEARSAQQDKQFQDFFKPPPDLLVQPQPPDPNAQDAQNQPQTQNAPAPDTDGGTK